jgi:purine nucleosidase
MTTEETDTLKACLLKSEANSELAQEAHSEFVRRTLPSKAKVIMDTDLGSDIDDSLALLTLLHLDKADVEVLGITTVYGCTRLRTRLCEMIVRVSSTFILRIFFVHFAILIHQGYEDRKGRTDVPIPVVCGEGQPLGSLKPIWLTGTEGWPVAPSEEISELSREDGHHYEAARFIIDQVKKFPKQVTIIGLGAATNLAIALHLAPEISSEIQHVVFMAMGNRMDHTVRTKWTEEYFPIPDKNEELCSGDY